MAITKEQFSVAAMVALIAASVGVLSSLATLYSQVSDIVGQRVATAIQKDFAPVGTVVASLLPPVEFSSAIGEIYGDELSKLTWTLADGREVIGTKFAQMTGNQPIPDLQGMFLRGLDPDDDREVGSKQNFATALPVQAAFAGTASDAGAHTHTGSMAPGSGDKYNAGGQNYFVPGLSSTAEAGAHSHLVEISGGGDEETRPDNVAVFYYVKIN